MVVHDKRASLYSSGGSEASVPVSPYRRRHATRAETLTGSLTSSQSGERPRVSGGIDNRHMPVHVVHMYM